MKRFGVVMLLILGAGGATAKVGGVSEAPAVRHQLELRKSRHELSLGLGMTLNDAYTRNVLIRAAYQYHFLSWLGVGLEAAFGAQVKTALTSAIESGVTNSPEYNQEFPGKKAAIPRSGIQALLIAKAGFVPLSGKLVLFGKYLGYVDLMVNAGGGMALVKGFNGLSNRTTYAVAVGGGLRFYPTRYLSVNLEVMDYMVPQYTPQNRKISAGESAGYVYAVGGGGLVPYRERLTQNPAFLVGVSVFLPFQVERTY